MTMDSEPNILQIDGELTIYRAAELKELLISGWEKTPVMELDLSGVTEVDGAGLQLLIMLKREAKQNNKNVRFVGHSPAVLEVVDLANLSGEFGDPLVLVAH